MLRSTLKILKIKLTALKVQVGICERNVITVMEGIMATAGKLQLHSNKIR